MIKFIQYFSVPKNPKLKKHPTLTKNIHHLLRSVFPVLGIECLPYSVPVYDHICFFGTSLTISCTCQLYWTY